MEIKITYDLALKRHPEQTEQVINKIRKRRGQSKDTPIEKMIWAYHYAVSGPSYRMQDIKNGLDKKHAKEWEKLSIDEKVKAKVAGTTVSLSAKAGRTSSDVRIEVCPDEIKQDFRDWMEHYKQKRDKYNAMTVEEREESLRESLVQLRQNPGFFVLKG